VNAYIATYLIAVKAINTPATAIFITKIAHFKAVCQLAAPPLA
jgi:hypothetical protein